MSNITTADAKEDQWIVIQHKTFVNWANEQLVQSNRSVDNLWADLCDGVKLVALVEALQFRKIGKVYSKPAGRIQMLHNVSLALKAVAEDNVKLVNIGTDDIVGGNLKLILGLLWHLIIRYQISSSKTKAPPKKLMLQWFQNALPGLNISNLTSDWRDGIALHALLEFCKPGLSPNWQQLSPKDSVQNCRLAMQLAKDQLSVPKVISVEDFCSADLDEMSAMTYLSYFIRKNSPGYYGTLNWACRQLKTTNISNLTTDWNDGYFLCSLVHSLGGEVKGWPNIDRKNFVATCQLGLDSAKKLGVDPTLTAAELADPNLDHLSLMAYLSKFQKVTPKKSNVDRLVLDCYLLEVKAGKATAFKIVPSGKDVEDVKVKSWVSGPSANIACKIKWENNVAFCSFQPTESGSHQLHVSYDGEEIKGCPISFNVQQDVTNVRVTYDPLICRVGQTCTIHVACSHEQSNSVEVRLTNPYGDMTILNTSETIDGINATFQPSFSGGWMHQTFVGNQAVNEAEIEVYDPEKAVLTGPEHGVVGDEIVCLVTLGECGSNDFVAEIFSGGGRKLEDVRITTYKDVRHITFTPKSPGQHCVVALVHGENVHGSPQNIEVVDSTQILVSGEGVIRGTKGLESYFTVNKNGLEGNITADVEVFGQRVACVKEVRSQDELEFSYVPSKAGTYSVNVYWERKLVAGSPFSVYVTDRSHVTLLDDLQEMKDDNDRLALEYDKPTKLNFDVSLAGPGTFKAEVLSPDGKLLVDVIQSPQTVSLSFVAQHEGDHYIHLYWSEAPIEYSPLHAYCPGPPLPVDASQVVIKGKGAESARATVPAEFFIDGRRAGPGVPKVKVQGIYTELPIEMTALKYDRYLCKYTSMIPGSFLLYIYWSEKLLTGCPLKIAVTAKGDVGKVKVSGEGFKGGISNHELKIFVDTLEAGPGEVTAECHSHRHSARCDIKENNEGQYTLRILPTEPEKHVLQIRYDGQHVPGSPFTLRIGEPPDPSQVKAYGPGILDGLIDIFESRFLVDTQGAGAGQLAVKIRGPRGGFKVDMSRETKSERTIVCRYDPSEPGQYIITVRWSGIDIPNSPFIVNVVETHEELAKLNQGRGYGDWRVEI